MYPSIPLQSMSYKLITIASLRCGMMWGVSYMNRVDRLDPFSVAAKSNMSVILQKTVYNDFTTFPGPFKPSVAYVEKL
jgi:hypothetical protein